MATQQVPHGEWADFFDDYSRKHEGKTVSAQLYGQGIPDVAEVKKLAFGGVTYEEKGSDAHSVRVMLGETTSDHLTHEVPSPTQVWVRSHEPGVPEMLEIHGSDDQRLILTFDHV